MSVVAFLLHPLGERDADLGSARGDNLANAMRWFRVVKDATRWAICYPTMAYLAAVDDVHHGPSMLVDHIGIALRCDVVVATGGAMSPHMRFIVETSRGRLPLLNLLDLGRSPQLDRRDETKLEILRRADLLGLD